MNMVIETTQDEQLAYQAEKFINNQFTMNPIGITMNGSAFELTVRYNETYTEASAVALKSYVAGYKSNT